MNEVLIGSLVDKVDAQERKIEEQENQINTLKEKTDDIPNYREILSEIKSGVDGLRTNFQRLSFPEKGMQELSTIIKTAIGLFEQPIKKEIVHHHNTTKITWVAAALFLAICLMSVAWYNTYDKLELYKANDTKYRYVRLNASLSLLKTFHFIDSLYRANPHMREFVIAKEEENQRNFEIMQRVQQMENEAVELKKKVKRSDKYK